MLFWLVIVLITNTPTKRYLVIVISEKDGFLFGIVLKSFSLVQLQSQFAR